MGRCVKGGSDEYIYGNGFNEIVAMMDNTGYRTYMLADAIGSVICTTSGSSGIYEIRYDAYGNDEPVGFAPVQEFGFAGMRYEADADIYLTPNRAYSPTLGRWLTPDPLGTMPNPKTGNRFSPLAQYTDGLNLYAYCGNDPVNGVDLMGLSISEWIVEAFETDTGEFISCMGDCLEDSKYCPRFILIAIGSRIPKIGKGSVASTKTIWQLKSVRNITGTTIRGAMKLGRIGAGGIILGGAYDSYRLWRCARQCLKN